MDPTATQSAPLADAACGVIGIAVVWGALVAAAAWDGPPVHDPADPWKLSHREAFHFVGSIAALDVVPVLSVLWTAGGVLAFAWSAVPAGNSGTTNSDPADGHR